jgi:hypothetical protein
MIPTWSKSASVTVALAVSRADVPRWNYRKNQHLFQEIVAKSYQNIHLAEGSVFGLRQSEKSG